MRVLLHSRKGYEMNKVERQYRFSELMTAIHLMEEDTDNPRLPNATQGLSDGKLRSAIMAQAFKEDEQFKVRLVNALANTALEPCANGDKPSNDDLSSLGMAIHLAWAVGAFHPLFTLIAMMGKVCDEFDCEIPKDLALILRPNKGVENFGKLDPIRILEGNYSIEEVIEMGVTMGDDDLETTPEVPEEILEMVRRLINEAREKE